MRGESFRNRIKLLLCYISGLVLFILLSGTLPFHGTGEKIYESIKKGIPMVSNLMLI